MSPSQTSLPLRHRSQSGASLVLVLAALALISFLAVAILTYTRSENRSSLATADVVQTQLLSELPEKLVISQIRRATKSLGNRYTWTSQPGMIRVFGNETPTDDSRVEAEEYYKLYSARHVTLGKDQAGELLSDADEFAAIDWQGQPDISKALYADLNEPAVLLPPLKQRQEQDTAAPIPVYPIFDPAATGVVDGCYYDVNALKAGRVNAHPYPMPARWIYVLRDGTLVSPEARDDKLITVPNASKENPIIGRIAYWTDDESSKLNINTATEPAPWDAPHTHTTTDEAYALSIPAKGDFYRFSGHPAYTSLAPVLRNFGRTASWDQPAAEREPFDPLTESNEWWQHVRDWHDLFPRSFARMDSSTYGGSQGGTVTASTESETKRERLFATVDELFFTTERTKNGAGTMAPKINQENLRSSRFFLTTHNRSPELNPFNRPKISLWPVQESTSERNETDKAFIAAGTIGTTPYYLQRKSSWQSEANAGSSQNQDSDMELSQNQSLYSYLLRMTTEAGWKIPGVGRTFVDGANGKYSQKSCEQLLAAMFDMIRWGINPATPYNQRLAKPLAPQYSFLAPGYNEPGSSDGIGGWSAAPLRVRGYGETVDASLPVSNAPSQWAKGYGRFPTITEAAIVFIPTEVATNATDGQPLNVDAYNDFADHTRKLKAFLVIEPFMAAVGGPPVSPVCQYRVVDLNGFALRLTKNGVVSDLSLELPGNAANRVRLSPAKPLTAAGNQPLGGGSTAFPGLLSQFLQLDGTPKLPGTGGAADDEDLNYSFISSKDVTLDESQGAAGSVLQFSGGTIKIQINDDDSASTAQVLEITFPPADIPVPLLAMADASKLALTPEKMLELRFTPTPGDTATSPPRMGNLIWRGDVVRSMEVHGEVARPYPLPGVGSVTKDSVKGITRGDLRLLAGRSSVRHNSANGNDSEKPEYFAPHPFYFEQYPAGTPASTLDHFFKAASLRDGAHMQEPLFPPLPTATTAGRLVGRKQDQTTVTLTPTNDAIPAVPPGTDGAFNLDGRPGDFDNGPGIIEDGPYINAPDFNNIANQSATGKAGWFQRGGEFNEEDGLSFSPWRQAASGIMFGSLPTGVYGNAFDEQPRPWETLLFCPNPAARTTAPDAEPAWKPDDPGKQDHFGFASPRDHLWLEFFRMPAVEPGGFADNVSTEGKVNMNYQLMPYTWIKRSTAMLGALHGVRLTAIPSSATTDSGAHYKNPSAPLEVQFRYMVNGEATLEAFEDRFKGTATGKSDVFRSPSEICDMWLVPKRITGQESHYQTGNITPAPPPGNERQPRDYLQPTGDYKKMLDWWEGTDKADPKDGFEATGDNLREAPYAQLYPRLCTRSNVFTIHYRVQLLKKSRSTEQDAVWDETKDNVVSDFRGQTTVERYLDPEDAKRIPDLTTNDDVNKAVDDYYRIRVVNRRAFAP